MKASITQSEEGGGGGIYSRVKVRIQIKEGGHLLGSLHGVGGGQRSGRGTVAREEEAADPPARVREEGEWGATWWAGSACWVA
jgi:hypothetical protein